MSDSEDHFSGPKYSKGSSVHLKEEEKWEDMK